jgi:hypothetical protein
VAWLAKSDKAEFCGEKCTIWRYPHFAFPQRPCVPDPDEGALKNRLAPAAHCGGGRRQASGEKSPPRTGPGLFSRWPALPGQAICPFFYEKGGGALERLIPPAPASAVVAIGPEGGFEARTRNLPAGQAF